MSTQTELRTHHAVAARHQRERLDIRERIKIRPQLGQLRLDVFAYPVRGVRGPSGHVLADRILAVNPVDGLRVQVLAQVNEHETPYARQTASSEQVLIFGETYALLGDVGGAPEHAEGTGCGVVFTADLTTGIADDQHGAV